MVRLKEKAIFLRMSVRRSHLPRNKIEPKEVSEMRLEAEENLWQLFYPQKEVSDSKLSLKRMGVSRIRGPREAPCGEHGPRGNELTARLPRPGTKCQHQTGCAEQSRTIPKPVQ